MDKQESLALFERAQAADDPATVWNAWAEDRLAERRELEASGEWETKRKDWEAAAGVDFSGHVFERHADFKRCIFPAWTTFEGATFKEDATFNNATFEEGAQFDSARFNKEVLFGAVTFNGFVFFNSTKFEGDARFDGARFKWNVTFDHAKFEAIAMFETATFEGDAWFSDAIFKGWARFTGARGERTFSLDGATFWRVPDFIQAHFDEAPSLDLIRFRSTVEPCGFWRSICNRKSLDASDVVRYRALKRLAIQAHDHDNELRFFAGEVCSRRCTLDTALPNPLRLLKRGGALWPGGWRFWFGVLYQLLSDFGRSYSRPLLSLALSFLFFTWLYLDYHFEAHDRVAEPRYDMSATQWVLCHTGRWTLRRIGLSSVSERPLPRLACLGTSYGRPLFAAAQISLKKSLLFIGWEQAEKINQNYSCLYGVARSYRDPEMSQHIPVIPDGVFVASLAQTLISAVLLFLLLLAIRNHFRIR